MHVSRTGSRITDMIEVCELIKDYGDHRAVNQLSFTAHPGVVTGLIGPEGAGKSTTMRIILGLDTPTSGTALVNGQRHTAVDRPMQTVGALPDAGAMHSDSTAMEHLQTLGRDHGIGRHRVVEVLGEVGLLPSGGKRIDDFSPAMRQRLGIASALLGDPGVLLFDEPMQGLDPEGIPWIRDLMQSLADQGRTVLVSSNQMSEMVLTADHLLVIDHGKLVMETSTAELIDRFQRNVVVRSPRRSGLAKMLTAIGATVRAESGGRLSVTGLDSWRIAAAAAEHHIPIQELILRNRSVEDFYVEPTSPRPPSNFAGSSQRSAQLVGRIGRERTFTHSGHLHLRSPCNTPEPSRHSRPAPRRDPSRHRSVAHTVVTGPAPCTASQA
jgi:ABC-2 type transport system ATP-binding protein